MTDFRLNPADDTGIPGDDVTTDRLPYFIGTTTPGYTVELFVNGQSAVWNTAVAGATQMDANGKPYNFLIRLPSNLNNGETTLYVEVVDQAGNISAPSNSVTVAITSTEVDYNGGTTSDPALFTRNTSTSQLQWLVQTPAGSSPPWFGPSGALYSSPSGTANDVPFQGDFDGDGLTDLAYYNLSTATWTIDESSNYAAQGAVDLAHGHSQREHPGGGLLLTQRRAVDPAAPGRPGGRARGHDLSQRPGRLDDRQLEPGELHRDHGRSGGGHPRAGRL